MESATADTRVEDYLNDKLQTLADLDTLDTLLSTVQSQQSLLRSQACHPTTPNSCLSIDKAVLTYGYS